MYSDALYNIGITKAIDEYYPTGGPVYYYHLAHVSDVSFTKFYGDQREYYGVAHGDEVQYLFPIHRTFFPEVVFSYEDRELVDVFVTMWYNFAKTG